MLIRKLFFFAVAFFLLHTIAGAQTLKFMGLSTGETKDQVALQLSRLGYKMACEQHATGECSYYAATGPEAASVRRMRVGFDHGVFTSLTFDFPIDSWNKLFESLVDQNGPPTRPLHAITNDNGAVIGSSIDWEDRNPDQCPCEGISLMRQGSSTSFMWINAPLALTP